MRIDTRRRASSDGENVDAMRARMTNAKDVRTPVIGTMGLTNIGVVGFRCAPEVHDLAAREQARALLERAMGDELASLARSFAEAVVGDRVKVWNDEKLLRVVAMSSDTFVCLTQKRYVEATKTVVSSMRRDKRLAPARVVDVSSPIDQAGEMEVLTSIMPAVVLGSFAELPNWHVFGEGENGTRYMCDNFWPEQPSMMTTACGVEIEHGVSCSRAHRALDRDFGENDDVELYFPSITAVVLRLQRLENVIDAMRLVDVDEGKLREFIRGGKVINIQHTPVMAQAAPEIGTEVAIIAFRRELPPNSGFKSMAEFLLAFQTRLGTVVPPANSPDDALLADVCFPGHSKPYLWPASLLLKSTGATELTARTSAVANDQVLNFLWNASKLRIVNTTLSFKIKRSAFMTKEMMPSDGCLLPEREFFHSAALANSLWPAVGMPSTFDTWINPFTSSLSQTDVFSPQDPLPSSLLLTPQSMPSTLPDPSKGALSTLNVESESGLEDSPRILSPARIAEPGNSKRARVDNDDEVDNLPAPVLGSRIMKSGELQASTPMSRSSKVPKQAPLECPSALPKEKPAPEPAPKPKPSQAAVAIAKKLGIASEDVPHQIEHIYEIIKSGKESELVTRYNCPNSIRTASAILSKFDKSLKMYDRGGHFRKKDELIGIWKSKLL